MLFAKDLATAGHDWLRFEPVTEHQPSGDHELVWQELERSDVRVFHIDGVLLRGKADVFNAIGKAMQFPCHDNWDCIEDWIRDLAWLPAKGYVIVVYQAEQFWQQSTRIAGTFTDICNTAADFWANQGISFHLVYIW